MPNEIDDDDVDEMDMPCPCQRCGDWFELNHGRGSKKWYPNTVICKNCSKEEKAEMERDEEIENALEIISNAEYDIKEAKETLARLQYVPE